ncbi:hypothetical protein NQ317_019504 [Molorchus minor]|uniref:Uncharacterized protein n=1 Tax=Molorchus minor TaxID=1323400 RepID=A0ABQ9JWK7_9CUCU|nr:hypothetical protein NQ317_019504 [Molorchus minor]
MLGNFDGGPHKLGQATTDPSISKQEGYTSDQIDKIHKSTSQTYETTERSEASIVTESRTDYSGTAPKRYTTKCYIKPVTVPTWYTESLYLKINSTKRRYEEKIYFKNKLVPSRWLESMNTEVKTAPKNIVSDIYIPVEESEVHYMSLEPQQIAAAV